VLPHRALERRHCWRTAVSVAVGGGLSFCLLSLAAIDVEEPADLALHGLIYERPLQLDLADHAVSAHQFDQRKTGRQRDGVVAQIKVLERRVVLQGAAQENDGLVVQTVTGKD
jgi:hypothetical protein